MTAEQLKRYRNIDDEVLSPTTDAKHSSTACCSHKTTAKRTLTEKEEEEEIMDAFIEKQKRIRENNLKTTAGDWLYS
jgi:glutaredoxin